MNYLESGQDGWGETKTARGYRFRRRRADLKDYGLIAASSCISKSISKDESKFAFRVAAANDSSGRCRVGAD
jgi:hypothetical protein